MSTIDAAVAADGQPFGPLSGGERRAAVARETFWPVPATWRIFPRQDRSGRLGFALARREPEIAARVEVERARPRGAACRRWRAPSGVSPGFPVPANVS